MAANSVRVLTLNVWHLQGDKQRQKRIREGIASLRPDLIALQEVVHTDDHDQLSDLLAGLNLHEFHQNDMLNPPRNDAHFGIALASKWKPTRVNMQILPESAPNACNPRCAIAATLRLPSGPSLLFMSVKPSWQLDREADRTLQAVAIAQFEAEQRAEAPSIIAGDFDAVPNSDSIRYLTGSAVVNGRSTYFHDAWVVGGNGTAGHTWTETNNLAAPEIHRLVGQPRHARRIDYILVGARHNHPGATARIQRCKVALSTPPVSDHYGVLADIQISN